MLFSLYPQVYFGFICMVLAIGLFFKLFDRKAVFEQHIRFIIIGCMFLFALVSILMQSQGRYKSSFIPIVCVLFGLCFDQIMLVIRNLVCKKKPALEEQTQSLGGESKGAGVFDGSDQ